MKHTTVTLIGSCLLVMAPAVAGDHPHSQHHAHGSPHGGIVETVGRYHLELVFDERNGTLTLYVLGQRDSVRHPIPAEPLTVRVEPADGDWFGGAFEAVLLPLPDDGDPAGRSSRFVGSDGGLIGLGLLRVSVRTELAGTPTDTLFSIEAGALRDVFVCPMRCEGSKSYDTDRGCPICGMALKPAREAHGDHSPKHGGILFMAPDAWHHLEGVIEPGEFRLYLYNDFTRPIAATPFADRGRVTITPLDDDGRPSGESQTLGLAVSGGGDYLFAPLPGYLSPPLDVDLRLQFEGRDEPDPFTFRFE